MAFHASITRPADFRAVLRRWRRAARARDHRLREPIRGGRARSAWWSIGVRPVAVARNRVKRRLRASWSGQPGPVRVRMWWSERTTGRREGLTRKWKHIVEEALRRKGSVGELARSAARLPDRPLPQVDLSPAPGPLSLRARPAPRTRSRRSRSMARSAVVALGLRRIGRCHPWAAGGIDRVPAARAGSESLLRLSSQRPDGFLRDLRGRPGGLLRAHPQLRAGDHPPDARRCGSSSSRCRSSRRARCARCRVIQPEIKKLQAKHKGDRQKMNEEMMALYKEHGVNPLGGCLPLLLQMPVLIGLFYVIRDPLNYLDARHAAGPGPRMRDAARRCNQFLGFRLDCIAGHARPGERVRGRPRSPCGDGVRVGSPLPRPGRS